MKNADSKSCYVWTVPLLQIVTRLNSPTGHQKANLLFFKNFNYSRTPLFELASLGKDSPIISEELLCSNEEIELYLKALDTKKAILNLVKKMILPITDRYHFVFERHVFSNDYTPLSIHQWGFTAKKSTLLSLCLKSLDKGKEMCAVYFDLSTPRLTKIE